MSDACPDMAAILSATAGVHACWHKHRLVLGCNSGYVAAGFIISLNVHN